MPARGQVIEHEQVRTAAPADFLGRTAGLPSFLAAHSPVSGATGFGARAAGAGRGEAGFTGGLQIFLKETLEKFHGMTML